MMDMRGRALLSGGTNKRGDKMKYPEMTYFNIVEIWSEELDKAVKDYCRDVLKMTVEEKRRQVIDDFRKKLFNSAIEYKKESENK